MGATMSASSKLSSREIECLEWLARGLRNRDISGKLGITQRTVALHLVSARTKLGAATREQTLAIAIKRGLIDP